MDDVHRAAWDQRESPARVKSILSSSTSSDKKMMPDENKIVYPWPQLIKESTKDGQTSYEITYPGDTSVVNETQGYDYTIWPEVEFVEELIRAYILRADDPDPSQLSSNEVSAIKRVSLNAIEFPITNQIYINKEEVKFFYEIWERLGFVVNYSRLGRGNSNSNSIYSLISDAENKNLVNALNKTNVFLIKKFKEYGISSANIIATLRQISNSGEGESWQKYIRGYYSTPYIRDFTKNDFSIEDNPIFITLNDANQSSEKLDEEAKLVDYINGSSTNEFTLPDTFPFTNSDWVKTNLSDGVNSGGPKSSNATNQVIKFNTQRNVISNFEVTDTNKTKRQICYDKLKNNLEWLTTIESEENIKRLAEYEFCICPEGNGVDTHRLWECIYLKVVPIVIKSASTDILKKNNIPLCVLDSWDSLDETKLNYKDFDFTYVDLSVCNLQFLQSCVFTEI
jgi:hypothetical protein